MNNFIVFFSDQSLFTCAPLSQALANAPFMPLGSGVVAIGRDCSSDRPCYWDCACRMLGQAGPSWAEWAHPTPGPPGDPPQETTAGECSPAFANRLCAEMWRPYLETLYVETPPNSLSPYEVDVKAVAQAVAIHARRIAAKAAEAENYVTK